MPVQQRQRIVFHVGGPAFHPVAEQARRVGEWLGQDFRCDLRDGTAAFDDLSSCDLLVVMGLHWTAMTEGRWGRLPYRPLNAQQQHAFASYVASGRPLLAHHGGIASYDDWPSFGELLGFSWIWGSTTHAPLGTYQVGVLSTGHPIVQGVTDYQLVDELYYNVQLTPGLRPDVHAQARWEGRSIPLVMTAEGGRVAGAGRTVYLANGHDMRAFACPALQRLWINSVRWLLAADV